jgi:L-threonylcarbamoyladenylate synthase
LIFKIIPETMDFEEDLINSVKTLKEGGVILYPTDTVWGLGCDATNRSAVEKIIGIKSRSSKSLIILVDGVGMLERYVMNVPDVVYELIEVSDTPLTIVYSEGKNLAPGVCSEDGSVGIRICKDEFCRNMIQRLKKPVVSTSANTTGQTTPSNFSEIDNLIINSADYVVKYRQTDNNKHSASSIIKVEENGVVKIIRK